MRGSMPRANGRVPVTHLPASIHKFTSIEQLDELPRELGWPLEYRQIEAGPFSSTFTDLDGDGWFLLEEQSTRTVEVAAGAPDEASTNRNSS